MLAMLVIRIKSLSWEGEWKIEVRYVYQEKNMVADPLTTKRLIRSRPWDLAVCLSDDNIRN